MLRCVNSAKQRQQNQSYCQQIDLSDLKTLTFASSFTRGSISCWGDIPWCSVPWNIGPLAKDSNPSWPATIKHSCVQPLNIYIGSSGPPLSSSPTIKPISAHAISVKIRALGAWRVNCLLWRDCIKEESLSYNDLKHFLRLPATH